MLQKIYMNNIILLQFSWKKAVSSTTVFNIDKNKKWFLRFMCYEGSCDSEHWCNDAENFASQE